MNFYSGGNGRSQMVGEEQANSDEAAGSKHEPSIDHRKLAGVWSLVDTEEGSKVEGIPMLILTLYLCLWLVPLSQIEWMF